MSGPTINRGHSEQIVETPDEFIHVVERKFGQLDWDLAATVSNAKAHLFITPGTDSLQVAWYELPVSQAVSGGPRPLLYLNPPYSDITPWAMKCATEKEQGAEILLLVPHGGQNWYWDWVEPYADVYSIGRLKFVGHKDPYPKDLRLCHYHKDSPTTRERRWRWQDE